MTLAYGPPAKRRFDTSRSTINPLGSIATAVIFVTGRILCLPRHIGQAARPWAVPFGVPYLTHFVS
jgi:hypothetical protein